MTKNDADSLDAYSRIKLADSLDRFTKALKQIDYLRIDCGSLVKEAMLAVGRIEERKENKEATR